jgi:hypothetical protein
MFRTKFHRPASRLLLFAALATAMVSAPAAASAAVPESTPDSPSSTTSQAVVQKEVARIKAGGLSSAALPPSVWRVDGSSDTWNGGCRALAHADYYPASDQAVMSTTVTSPYWFAACRGYAQLWIETSSGSFPSAANYAMACAVLDPTCASTQTTTGDYGSATPALTAFVAAVNDALQAAGLPPTYTRAMAVKGVHLTFANAG